MMQRVLNEIQPDPLLFCDECEGAIIVSKGDFTCTSCGLILGKSLVTNRRAGRNIDEYSFLEYFSSNVLSGTNIHGGIHNEKYWRRGVINQEKENYATNQYAIKHYKLIDRICKSIDLPPNICLRSMQIFYSLSKKKVSYQKPVLIAVSITKATCEAFYPIKIDEILTVLNQFGKKVVRRVLNRCLIDLNIKIPTYSPRDYVPRYLSIFQEKFPDLQTPSMLYQLLDLYKPFFNNSRPSVYAFCCIVISFNIEYHLSRNVITKLYRNNPSSYYALFDRILAEYNAQYQTAHSFS